jgi:hypothetical protein
MDFTSLNDHEIKALLMQYDSEMRKLSFQMQVIQSTIQKLHESLNASVPQTEQDLKTAVPENTSGHKTELSMPKPVKGIEYPKKRTPKTDLEEKDDENKNSQPMLIESENAVLNEKKKRGPKPKNNGNVEIKEPKKRGPKPKIKQDTTVPRKRGPKPKLKSTGIIKNNASVSLMKRKYTKENPWPEFVVNTLSKYGHLMNSAQLYELADEENKLHNYGLDNKELRAMVSRAFHQLSNNKKTIIKLDIRGSKSYNYGLSAWINEQGEVSEQYLP